MSDVYRRANVRTEQFTELCKSTEKLTTAHRYTATEIQKQKLRIPKRIKQYTNTSTIQSVSNRKFSSVKKLNRLEFYLINHHHV